MCNTLKAILRKMLKTIFSICLKTVSFRPGVPNQGCSHPLGVRGSILGGARWSFRFLCCTFVLSCSVHDVLIVLHNQCLITACLMRGLQFSPKRCEIGDDLFFYFEDHPCNNGIIVRKLRNLPAWKLRN